MTSSKIKTNKKGNYNHVILTDKVKKMQQLEVIIH